MNDTIVQVPLKFKNERAMNLTYDNNIIYFDEAENQINCFGMISNKIVQSRSVKEFSINKISRIAISLDNESYFIGVSDGSV